MIEPLKPCPFCGGNADTIDENVPEGYYPWVTFCRNCHITTPNCETLSDAEKLWNTRVEPECEHEFITNYDGSVTCHKCNYLKTII